MITVETAAIRIGEAVFTLPRPNRHHNVMWWLSTLGISSALMKDQGFVCSDGRYVERQEALILAKAAGQLIENVHGGSSPIAPPNLYSEDLWDEPSGQMISVPELTQIAKDGLPSALNI
jgi:hypothetical protein